MKEQRMSTTRRAVIVASLALAVPAPAGAQFRGPSAAGRQLAVAEAQNVRPGTYVNLEGAIVAHLREDYFQFRDPTGEIRVEIEPGLWRGREVSPADGVRILGEVDRTSAGVPNVWVKSLEILP
jgi:uncharacterized protein (TIGR00156 family)